MYKKTVMLLSLAIVVTMFVVSTVSAVPPFGANYTEERTERYPEDGPESHDAIAGNVTELDITGFSITKSWQGYYGNVSGTILLGDASGNVMYNWSVATPEGEVYATESDSIDWNYVQCFNFTATGTFEDDTENAGGTSQHGLNLNQLHENFSIEARISDSVNNTFSLDGSHESGGGFVHNTFFTNNLRFDEGQCPSTHIFTSSGPEDGTFQQVLLYEPLAQTVIFTSIIDNLGSDAFDGVNREFQMLVLDDGREDDTSTTTYYFYVELE